MRTYIVRYSMKSFSGAKDMYVKAENKQDAWLETIHNHHSGDTPLWAVVRGVINKDGSEHLFKTDIKHPY